MRRPQSKARQAFASFFMGRWDEFWKESPIFLKKNFISTLASGEALAFQFH